MLYPCQASRLWSVGLHAHAMVSLHGKNAEILFHGLKECRKYIQEISIFEHFDYNY